MGAFSAAVPETFAVNSGVSDTDFDLPHPETVATDLSSVPFALMVRYQITRM